MKAYLWLRKKAKKLTINSTGFSSVIGTVFMVLVMILFSSVFLWTLSQNTLYNQTVKGKNQMELDRLSEKVTASDVNYTVAGDVVSVEVALENDGPIPVEIVSLWVIDVTMNKYNFSNNLNINLKPGNITYLQGSKAVNVTIDGSFNSDQFGSWFVTARGNVIPLEKEGGIILAQVSAGIGSVSMDFSSFQYFNVSKSGGSYILNNYPNGGSGYRVIQPPSGRDVGIAFKVRLTNFDPDKREIKLFSASVLWTLFPVTSQQPRGASWYIVNVDNNGTINDNFTTVTIPYGASVDIFFASAQDINSGGFETSLSSYTGTGPVNLALVGEIGSSPYGQNIPFASIYIEEEE